MKEISIIIGSDSDVPILKDIVSILDDFEVSYDRRIISAHRTPEILYEYIKSADKDGIKLFITVAGMSAALPGVVASLTTKPVIGVPAYKDGNPFSGMDALLSMVQMPPGVPVATVSVNGGKNAALLALRILSLEYERIASKLIEYAENQKRRVLKKDQEMKSGT